MQKKAIANFEAKDPTKAKDPIKDFKEGFPSQA
jgi:hypothetical protein